MAALSAVTTRKDALIIEKAVYKNTKKDSNPESLYNEVIYQVIGDVISGVSSSDLKAQIKKGGVGWEHPVYAQVKTLVAEQDGFVKNPFPVADGIGKCPDCSGRKAYSASKQTRGGDEGSTQAYRCADPKCRRTWVYSG